MSKIDFERYEKFVDAVTSDASTDFVALSDRLVELDEKGANIERLLTAGVGLNAEGGEFLEIVKKMIFQGKPWNEDNKEHLIIELGDLMWYAAQACMALGVSFDEVGLSNFDPAIKYFNDLAKNSPIVPKQTSYARVVSGEIPILFDYDFNAYRGKYEEDGNFEFVLPCEGSVRVPYVMSLVNNGPNPELGKKVLDFILSDKGQAIWTNAYLQPSRPVELPAEVAAKFLPASDYARAVAVDYAEMEKAQSGFGERYLSEVK